MKITTKQFKRFSELVYHECGINLHDGKVQLLAARLAKRMRRTAIDSVDEYLRLLEGGNRELIDFIDAISTNHTYFFRENHHFEIIENGHFDIWCAASSSGEEPYSIAIHCLEMGFSPSIFATDISTNVLQLGETGVYSIDRTKKVPQHLLRKYFQKGNGKWNGYLRVKEEIRRMLLDIRTYLMDAQSPIPNDLERNDLNVDSR